MDKRTRGLSRKPGNGGCRLEHMQTQLVIGLFANAFSLVADAAHTLSDLVTDLLVLLAARHGADPADINHPYGHGRIETATKVVR